MKCSLKDVGGVSQLFPGHSLGTSWLQVMSSDDQADDGSESGTEADAEPQQAPSSLLADSINAYMTDACAKGYGGALSQASAL